MLASACRILFLTLYTERREDVAAKRRSGAAATGLQRPLLPVGQCETPVEKARMHTHFAATADFAAAAVRSILHGCKDLR